MGKKKGNFFMGLLALSLVLGLLSGPVLAESNLAVGGSATAKLDFQINIPTILYLQVGSDGLGAVDTVSCTLNNIPGSGPVAMTSTGVNTVRAAAIVGSAATVTLNANSNTALNNGTGGTIPFNQISCAGSGNFGNYTFDTTAAQQVAQWTGPGNRTGTYTFTYANANYYPTGNYIGSVTYTLSSP